MSRRSTWIWFWLAAGLFGLIVFYERHGRRTVSGPVKILPQLQAAAVNRVQIVPLGQPEIRVERTNGTWRLRAPIVYPAQSAAIESLLSELERLTPATYLAPRDLRDRPRAEEEYGLAPEQVSIFIHEGDRRSQVKVGQKTPPGDQVFLQVAGTNGVYVVDAGLLNFVPHRADDWRDRALIDLKGVALDRIAVTNGATIFELQRDPSNQLWRMTTPNPARANNARIEAALQDLQRARVNQFVGDNPKPDLEALGLQPPEWELALSQGTNRLVLLQFGRSLTNSAPSSSLGSTGTVAGAEQPAAQNGRGQVYARRLSPAGTDSTGPQSVLVTLSNEFMGAWRGSVNDFRDPHLVALSGPAEAQVEAVEVRGEDSFSLQRNTNGEWRVLPQNYSADPVLVKDLLSVLNGMQIIELVKEIVIEPDLGPLYGLAPPAREYIIKAASATGTNGGAVQALRVLADLQFGTNQNDKVYARRADESSVYAVKPADVGLLPSASWQLRQRQIWDVSEEEVGGVTIRQGGKVRQLLRQGQAKWSLAPGSQGVVDGLAEEETVRGLCHLAAAAWVARGQQHRADYGFSPDGQSGLASAPPGAAGRRITLDLKNGGKLNVEFARGSPSSLPYYAGVVLEGEFWIFEFPVALGQAVLSYLSVPDA